MNEALATWIPGPIMAAVMLFALGVLWKSIIKRLDKIEDSIALLHRFATLEQLGNLGNRLDEHHSALRDEIGSIRERLATLEGQR
jgi:hypothetical protein